MKIKTPSTKVSKLALTFVVQHLSKVVNNVEISRQTLYQTHAYKVGTVWKLESTDGHRLVTNEVDASEIETNMGDSLSFRCILLPKFKLALSKAKKLYPTEMIDLEKLVETCGKNEFPDTSSLASENGYEWQISFNAEYLEEMLQAMRDNKRQTNVTLKMKSPTDPIKVSCGGTSYGLLMPVRGSTQWGVKEEEKAPGITEYKGVDALKRIYG